MSMIMAKLSCSTQACGRTTNLKDKVSVFMPTRRAMLACGGKGKEMEMESLRVPRERSRRASGLVGNFCSLRGRDD